jgi:hypothetical protein
MSALARAASARRAARSRRFCTPLAGHQLESLAPAANEDRLQQALLFDRRRELAQALFVNALPDLKRRRVDPLERHRLPRRLGVALA